MFPSHCSNSIPLYFYLKWYLKEKYFIYSQSLQIKHKFLNICELKRRNMFQIKLMGLHPRHIFPKCFLYFQNFFYIYIRLSKVMFCTCWFQVCFCPRHITIPYFLALLLQRILTPLWHLIPSLILAEARVCSAVL